MRFELTPDSRVLIDLRATGLLRAMGHDPTLTAHPEIVASELDSESFVVRFPVRNIEPPAEISASDKAKMIDNTRGSEVLDASRHPFVEARLCYAGTLSSGSVKGDLVVRGQPHPFEMDVRITRDGDVLSVTGTWEGTLADVGVKPFKALFGALKLRDWIRLRLEAKLRIEDASHAPLRA